jgi:hypothetical protein
MKTVGDGRAVMAVFFFFDLIDLHEWNKPMELMAFSR